MHDKDLQPTLDERLRELELQCRNLTHAQVRSLTEAERTILDHCCPTIVTFTHIKTTSAGRLP